MISIDEWKLLECHSKNRGERSYIVCRRWYRLVTNKSRMMCHRAGKCNLKMKHSILEGMLISIGV